MTTSTVPRAFLFLQGPPGPLFRRLAEQMAAHGITVFRINLSGGDRRDWPDGAVDYTGRFADWPAFVDQFMVRHQITDLMLFGDCRPYHVSAHRMASARGLDIHVMEEGYIRPHWMTLEPEGVNGNSTLPHDPDWFIAQARRLPPVPSVAPVTASFERRSKDSYWYYHHVVTGRLRYPHYRSHRPGSLVMDGISWLRKLATRRRVARAAEQGARAVEGKPYFLLPLQLSADYQIRTHSAFADMESAARYVVESFAGHASLNAHLLVKAHPLNSAWFDWPAHIRRLTREYGLQGRLHYIDGGDLDALTAASRGMVCVNSTSATIALEAGIPVCALGDAIYRMPRLTHQGHIDQFWSNPLPPDRDVWDAFCRVLHDRCLVHGGLASESAVSTLIEGLLARLL